MDLLSLAQAAECFGVQRRTLLAAIDRGALAAEKVGKMWVVRPAAVQRWIDRGKHTPGPPKKRKPGRPAPEPARTEDESR